MKSMTEEKDPLAPIETLVDDSIREKQARLVTTVLGILNLMTAFAAPHYLAQIDRSKEPAREEVLALFDEFLVMFDRPDTAKNDAHVLLPMRRMRKLLESWAITSVAPAAVISTARECLRALGVPEPNEGWNLWEPPREERP
jgi:hypothetical protein